MGAAFPQFMSLLFFILVAVVMYRGKKVRRCCEHSVNVQ
jgi:hypothetical protein